MQKLSNFCTKHEMAAILGFSPHTLKLLRQKFWLEGVHFIRANSRTIRYNKDLCLNWLATRNFPSVHQITIENYLRELEQNRSP